MQFGPLIRLKPHVQPHYNTENAFSIQAQIALIVAQPSLWQPNDKKRCLPHKFNVNDQGMPAIPCAFWPCANRFQRFVPHRLFDPIITRPMHSHTQSIDMYDARYMAQIVVTATKQS